MRNGWKRRSRRGASSKSWRKKWIAAGEAKGSVEGQYLKFGSLSPEVAKAVSSMKKGEVSPLIRIGKQFSLLKLEDIRYPKDKAAREQAEKEALAGEKGRVPEKRTRRGCERSTSRSTGKLVDNLDFESAEPGFEKLRADGRVLAKVKGEKPVTVGDLTAALEKKFFHGAERAAEEKKINRKKDQVLEEILNRRVTLMEAKMQKLDRTEYFKGKAQENRNGVLFGAFVQKVIAPGRQGGR